MRDVASGIVMHMTRGCLVVPLQTELYDDDMIHVQSRVLEKINETRTKGVIIDLSAVRVIDSFLAQAIFDTARMALLLGATLVISGLRPGIVASLIDLDMDLGEIRTAINLEEAFQQLKPIVEPKQELEDIKEQEIDIDEGIDKALVADEKDAFED